MLEAAFACELPNCWPPPKPGPPKPPPPPVDDPEPALACAPELVCEPPNPPPNVLVPVLALQIYFHDE